MKNPRPLTAALVTALPLLLTAGARSAFAQATQTETFRGIYTPVADPGKVSATANPAETSLYLVFGFSLGGTFNAFAQALTPSSVPLGPTTFTKTFNVPLAATNLRAGVLSLYAAPAANTGVAAALANSTFIGMDFTTAFPFGGYSELEIGNDLSLGSTTQLANFFAANLNDFAVVTQNGTPVTATIIDFSTGTAGGTAALSFTPVPEPGSLTLAAGAGLGVVGAALARRRRRPEEQHA